MSALGPPPGFRGVWRADELARAVYSEAAGVGRIIPRGVAVPVDVADVEALVRWAAAVRVPLTARGSGSSMANGAIGPGVIVDLSRLDGVGPVQWGAERVTVGAGVIAARVQEAALPFGLRFPVDPSSSAFATIGGMCATHAAGARQAKYGPLRHWIHGLECVFADGSRAWVRRGEVASGIPAIVRFERDVAAPVRGSDTSALRHEGVRKESSGYALAAWRESGDAVDLLLGSEGTLAMIVAVELRLTRLPRATASLLASFSDLERAAATAVQLSAAGASAVELLDRSFLEIARSEGATLAVAPEIEAVLLVEAETTERDAERGSVSDLIGELAEQCRRGGAEQVEVAMGAEAEAELWRLRHAASPILSRLAPRYQSLQLVEDGCVPPARFAEYVRGVRAALGRTRLRGVIFGHASEAHAHVNAMVDTAEGDWRSRCEQLVDEVTTLVAGLGGTLAGEHGDGRLRAPLLSRVWPAETVELFAATKRAFDPDGILNPGVKVAPVGARSLEEIKYDPALPPLPAAARAVLDRVVRERAWASMRLELLQEERGRGKVEGTP